MLLTWGRSLSRGTRFAHTRSRDERSRTIFWGAFFFLLTPNPLSTQVRNPHPSRPATTTTTRLGNSGSWHSALPSLTHTTGVHPAAHRFICPRRAAGPPTSRALIHPLRPWADILFFTLATQAAAFSPGEWMAGGSGTTRYKDGRTACLCPCRPFNGAKTHIARSKTNPPARFREGRAESKFNPSRRSLV